MSEQEQINVLLGTRLFGGITETEIRAFLASAALRVRRFAKGERIISEGEISDEVFVLLSGRATGERSTRDGRTLIVNEMSAGDVFGDLLSGASEKSPVDVTANTECELLSFKIDSILLPDKQLSAARSRLLRNLILVISDKYFVLNRRVRILESNSLRERIAIYLYELFRKHGSSFTLPHSREEQARYLASDRSALSRELSRMKREGLIDYSRNEFTILNSKEISRLATGR